MSQTQTTLCVAALAGALTLFSSAPKAQSLPRPEGDAAFLAENAKAMDRMMDEMTITPSGDPDRDFVGMMVPHHQGAIDMARAELRFGKNETLRRIAQEIIVTQQQEIEVMRLAVPPAANISEHHAMPNMTGDHP